MKKIALCFFTILVLTINLFASQETEFINNLTLSFIDNLIIGKESNDFPLLADSINNDQTKNALNKISQYLKDLKFEKRDVVESRTSLFRDIKSGTKKYYNITYDYKFNSTYALISIRIIQYNNEFKVDSINVVKTLKPANQLNEFVFKNKPLLNYIFLLFTMLIPVFIITTIVFMFKLKLKPKKTILWLILMLFGVIKFTLNWDTGDIGFAVLNFQLLGSGFLKYPIYQPYMIFTSIPLASIIFWVKYRT